MTEQVKKPEPKPFFVRFLEQQQVLTVQTEVKAGGNHTMKYPSDGDEGVGS